MKIWRTVLVAALIPAMPACLDVDESEVDTEETSVDESELTLCLAPPTPPAPNLWWSLTLLNPTRTVHVDPPNDACAGYVIDARNVENFEVEVTAAADTPEKCVGTTLDVRRYTQSSNGTWSSNGLVSATGVWTYQGCRLPSVTWNANTWVGARVHIKTKRAYVSGRFSVLQHGLPFRASALVLQPPN